ncbi:MAG: sensor domain-containing diguanylate cyclase [Spirochaetes bacterium]|jgi:diguanylate cyclase (GGDEF)-like protein|nr:sensor domain-containing diguanylate cyclase [Spirochaetota bacterium]
MEELFKIKKLYSSIGKIITSSLEFGAIQDAIMEEIHLFFDAENWSLMRLDPNTDELFFVIVKGIDAKAVENIRLGRGEGIAGTVARTRKSIFVPDTSRDKRFSDRVDRATGFKTRSLMAVPVIFGDTLYGVIELVNRGSGGLFTEMEHLILQTIADYAAIAFANAALYEQALQRSLTDPLTGLLNRAKLEQVIAEAEKSAFPRRRRYDDESAAVVVMVDVDDFKKINDGFGHPRGDEVLKEISRILKSRLRYNDMLFRIGGDEFLAIIPASLEQMQKIEKRFAREMKKLSSFTMEGGPEVRFSYGTSAGPFQKVRDLIQKADAGMYRHKGTGRT